MHQVQLRSVLLTTDVMSKYHEAPLDFCQNLVTQVYCAVQGVWLEITRQKANQQKNSMPGRGKAAGPLCLTVTGGLSRVRLI